VLVPALGKAHTNSSLSAQSSAAASVAATVAPSAAASQIHSRQLSPRTEQELRGQLLALTLLQSPQEHKTSEMVEMVPQENSSRGGVDCKVEIHTFVYV